MNTLPLSKTDVASRLVVSLFAVLAMLQVLDWHSTVTAASTRSEQNQTINVLAHYVGLPLALSCVKLFDLCVVALLFRSWQASRRSFNLQFLLVLTLMCFVYMTVVISNYSA